MLDVVDAHEGVLLEQPKRLFVEYAESLDFDLSLQNFEKELACLPGAYAPPSGCLLLALVDGEPAGCVAMRRCGPDVVEMKRLFVRPAFRSRGVGRRLVDEVLMRARAAGYKRMRLDSLPSMTRAIELYRSRGFEPIPAYIDYPIEGVVFLEVDLWRDAAN